MYRVLSRGIYSFSEAARLSGVGVQRIRYWFLGRGLGREPVRESDYAREGIDAYLLSFLDLTDVLIMNRFREYGVSLQYLRKIQSELVRALETYHPFSSKRLLTDGKKVFVHVAYESGDETLKELLSRQHSFPDVLKPYLTQIDYDPDSWLARIWRPTKEVAIDPERKFGKPIIDSTGIATSILAAAYDANQQDEDLVAAWYGAAAEDVRAAVSYEESLRKQAA